MREQGRVGKAAGIPQIVTQKNGDMVRLAPGKAGKFAEVRAGRLVLDGDIIAPADGEPMAMRRRMAFNGLVVVAIGHHKHRVKVDAFGLPLVEDYDAFVEEAENDVMAALAKMKGADRHDEKSVAEAARLAARRAAQRWSGKKPQVKVMMLAGAVTP